MRARTLVAWLAVSLLLPSVPAARAEQRDSIQLFNEASDLADKGRFKEAIAIWLMVADEIPAKYRPAVQVNLGLAYRELGELPEAWHHLGRYLAVRDDKEARGWQEEIGKRLSRDHVRYDIHCEPEDATLYLQSAAGSAVPYACPLTWWFKPGKKVPVRVDRKDYKRHIEMIDVVPGKGPRTVVVRLTSAVEYGFLEVHGDARAVQVFLNGMLEGSVPFKRKLKAGTYELMVGAPGKMPWKKTVTVKAGERIVEAPEVARKVIEKPVTTDPEPGPTISETGNRPGGIAPWKWVVLGGGVAALAGGATMHGLAYGRNEELKKDHPDGSEGKPAPASNKSAYDAAYDSDVQPLLIGAWALYGLGGAAAVVGTVLLFVDTNSDDAEDKTVFAPLVSPDSLGMSFSVAF